MPSSTQDADADRPRMPGCRSTAFWRSPPCARAAPSASCGGLQVRQMGPGFATQHRRHWRRAEAGSARPLHIAAIDIRNSGGVASQIVTSVPLQCRRRPDPNCPRPRLRHYPALRARFRPRATAAREQPRPPAPLAHRQHHRQRLRRHRPGPPPRQHRRGEPHLHPQRPAAAHRERSRQRQCHPRRRLRCRAAPRGRDADYRGRQQLAHRLRLPPRTAAAPRSTARRLTLTTTRTA